MEDFTSPLKASLEAAGFEVEVTGGYIVVNKCRYRVYRNHHGTIRLYANYRRSPVMRRRKRGYDLNIAVTFIISRNSSLCSRPWQSGTSKSSSGPWHSRSTIPSTESTALPSLVTPEASHSSFGPRAS